MDAARAILRSVFGFASFRPLQQEIVEAILAGRDVLVLMPTGGGKSLCYQLPALLLEGLTVVVSPLIALMKDQVDRLRAMGVAATFINSSLDGAEIGRRQAAVARGEIKLVYVAPERLVQPGFLALLRASHPTLFAVDEAHCISEWGHDFRPEYREMKRIRELFPTVPIAAFTATATRRVEADIASQLDLRQPKQFRGSFNRTNLYYDVRPKAQAFEQLYTYIRQHPNDAGIVYCLARAATEDVAQKLRTKGINAVAYHAGVGDAERAKRQEAFMRDEAQVVVATIAFGMGIDKPDGRYVVHFDLPRHLEGYYQESGRAGRDGDPADCILFYSPGDAMKLQRFIDEKGTDVERRVATQQLRQMMAWAEAMSCRRQALLIYFDETTDPLPSRCCDVCDSTYIEEDWTIPAQMFLSCAKRVRERFGAAHLIDVLRGSQSERIKSLQHDQLSTYGIGHDHPKEWWQQLARHLLAAGFIRQDAEDYPAVRCTDLGNAVHFNGQKVMARVPYKTASAPTTAAQPNLELFERLRVLRKRLADERGLPPYAVFGDRALRQMAAELPTTATALLRVSGVGERKLADYGDLFMAAIADYVQETGAEPVRVEPPPAPLLKPLTAPQPRAPGDVLTLTIRTTLDRFRAGLSPQEIASERGLTLATVETHIAEAIEAGTEIDLRRLVTPDHEAAIRQAIAAVGDGLLTPLRDRLGDAYGYGEIRYVRAAIRARLKP
jgi:ATP-dependent DNA helicase RecQ